MNTPVSLQIIGGKNTATVFWMIKKKSTKFFERLWAQPTQYKFRLWILDLHKLTRKCPYSTSTARHVLSNRLCWTPTLCISKEIVALGCGSNNNVKVEHLQKGSRRLVRTGATGQRPLLSGRGWSVGSVSASRLRQHLTRILMCAIRTKDNSAVWSPSTRLFSNANGFNFNENARLIFAML